jgi:hypothetical protein
MEPVRRTGHSTYERSDFRTHLCQLGGRYRSLSLSASFPPIHTLHLVRQHYARAVTGNDDLERIALDLCCHRAADHQTRLCVVGGGAQNNRWSVSGLLMSCLRTEADPDDVASVGHIGPRHLPRLLADRTAKRNFRVQILASDPLHKLGQIIFLAPYGFDDNATRFLAHVNGFIQTQMSRL